MIEPSANLYHALCPAAASPDRPAIHRLHGPPLSHGDLDRLSAQLAHRLVDLRVRPGDRVAVQVNKSAEALVLYLACLRAGAVYLPLNTGYTLSELTYFIDDAEPRLMVIASDADAALPELADRSGATLATLDDDGASGSLLDGLARLPDRFDTLARGADDLAAILYTSGTTGRPKGAMLSHGNLHSNAATLARE